MFFFRKTQKKNTKKKMQSFSAEKETITMVVMWESLSVIKTYNESNVDSVMGAFDFMNNVFFDLLNKGGIEKVIEMDKRVGFFDTFYQIASDESNKIQRLSSIAFMYLLGLLRFPHYCNLLCIERAFDKIIERLLKSDAEQELIIVALESFTGECDKLAKDWFIDKVRLIEMLVSHLSLPVGDDVIILIMLVIGNLVDGANVDQIQTHVFQANGLVSLIKSRFVIDPYVRELCASICYSGIYNNSPDEELLNLAREYVDRTDRYDHASNYILTVIGNGKERVMTDVFSLTFCAFIHAQDQGSDKLVRCEVSVSLMQRDLSYEYYRDLAFILLPIDILIRKRVPAALGFSRDFFFCLNLALAFRLKGLDNKNKLQLFRIVKNLHNLNRENIDFSKLSSQVVDCFNGFNTLQIAMLMDKHLALPKSIVSIIGRYTLLSFF